MIVLMLPNGTSRHVALGTGYVAVLTAAKVVALLLREESGGPGPFHVLAIVRLLTIAGGVAASARCRDGGRAVYPVVRPGAHRRGVSAARQLSLSPPGAVAGPAGHIHQHRVGFRAVRDTATQATRRVPSSSRKPAKATRKAADRNYRAGTALLGDAARPLRRSGRKMGKGVV
jgi:hypothetical protein